jgi:hypothetical protein
MTNTAPFIILWKYEVTPENRSAFEKAYGPKGDWARLFSSSEDYLGSNLYHSPDKPEVFLIMDQWINKESYDTFKELNNFQYNQMSMNMSILYMSEVCLGEYHVV